ncbi:MAG TPA: ribonuclease R, partial [Salinisphaeraceae bacterium]|nr:ribonuclease R [Salinisphaeraceae bacterium]
DPDYEREQHKYSNPVPSRRLILQDLAASPKPMRRKKLAALYDLKNDAARAALDHRLSAMLRDGQLLENRRGALGLIERMDLVRGRVQGHRDGFGFLIPEDKNADDVFLSPRQMRAVMHGDRVVVRIVGHDFRGRREGQIAEVLERVNSHVVGRLKSEQGMYYLIPDNARISQDIIVPQERLNNAKAEQIVTVRLLEPPGKRNRPVGEVVEILGAYGAPGMEIDIALRAHGIPFVWPADVEAEAAEFGTSVSEADLQGREDLRDLPLVTIDGADACDFDDAVYARKTRAGWRLWVAIADVSAYVTPGSALDAEAERRGTSVYFPDYVVPMLPQALSNGLCSLNPDVDRLSLVCEMRFDRGGQLKASRFYSAVIRSQARLRYAQVADWLETPENLPQRHAHLAKPLRDLHGLYTALATARQQRGTIEFETTATRIIFNEERKIERVVPEERNVAHRIIEECMIAANVATARHLARRRMPVLYRIHERPGADALADVRAFLAERGLSLGGGAEPAAADYDRVLRAAHERSDFNLIQTVLLRSMQRALYSPHNEGHFGLALEHYAHFTSPIRRYPDLLAHRAIKHLEQGRKPGSFAYDTAALETLGVQCSTAEQRADDATRDVDDWLKCEYLSDSLGEEFAGTVVGVTAFGLFVELDKVRATGLIHISSLSNDYYHFDAIGHCLRGERSGRVFQLADTLRVRVVRVDLEERKIDFDLLEGEHNDRTRSQRRKKSTSRRKSK